MVEVRLAQKGDMVRQKEIWKLCFGDSDHYIDFYYANRYKETETVVLLDDKEIVSMLTMLPIKIITSTQQIFNSTMLYAIATHPKYQNRGFATEAMNFTHQFLRENEIVFSVLVPSGKQLFDFYRQRGYQDGFFIREVLFTQGRIESLESIENCHCIMSKISPEDYNQTRNKLLSGRLYVAYPDEEIAYQQSLSRQSGADIFGIEINKNQGWVVIERLNSDKILIKELLISDQLLSAAIQQIAQLWPAKEYVLRTPSFWGQRVQGTIRPFGMIKAIQQNEIEITAEEIGYLGFAFD